MPQTPDRHPGQFIEDDGIQLTPDVTSPVSPGEVRYVSGSGFVFNEEGELHTLVDAVNYRKLSLINETGPFENFPGAYYEIVGGLFPVTSTWYTDVSKTSLIQRKMIDRNGIQNPTTITWNMYAVDGVTVTRQYVDAITYSGSLETSRTRTRTI